MVYFGIGNVDGSDMKTCPKCQVSYPVNYMVCPADGSPLEEVGSWTEGSIIRGKYRLLAKVGQGGMGAVYKALHLAFDELRALKVIAPELLSDELFVKRFKHEARITRLLQHPNAVRVDDIDEAEDGRPFIVMEFIEGKSLKKLIREEGPLPAERVLSIIKQAAGALEAAHRQGMVHRDIKPDNISLVDTPDGEMVKVLDFGIAKMKEARMGEAAGLTLTGAGVVIGTPQYMSPEQAMGKRGEELDGRADLYSLGVVMYQMLTADLPFRADTTMEMLLAHMQKAPQPIATAHPELQVPENVAALTLRLLEKNREMRPATARALIQEIETIEAELANPLPTRYVPTGVLTDAFKKPASVQENRGGAKVGIPRGSETPAANTPEVTKVEPRVEPRVEQRQGATGRKQEEGADAARAQVPVPPDSRWGLWVALAVLVIGIGGGVAWLAMRKGPPTHDGNAGGSVTATLSAAPSSVAKGQPVTLRWTSQNATELSLEPSLGKVDPQGSILVTPESSTVYILTAIGPAGTRSYEAPVRVTSADSSRDSESTDQGLKKSPEIQKKLKSKLAMGKFWLDRNDYDKAIAYYKEAAELDPSNSEVSQDLHNAVNECKVLNPGQRCGGD
jgi:serine/threonine protein kinase